MNQKSLKRLIAWQGKAAILPGLGIFYGVAGDNCEHRHWAHQLSIGLDDEVMMFANGNLLAAAAIFVSADLPHRISPGKVLSVYIEPKTPLAESLIDRLGKKTGMMVLPKALKLLLHRCFLSDNNLEQGAIEFQRALTNIDSAKIGERSRKVIASLQNILTEGKDINRYELAQLVDLSPSRFSHWFKEDTGMSFRSYRKWLHLMRGIRVVLQGESLSAAAYDASFADQAHFSRTFKKAFGVSLTLALSGLTQDKIILR